MDLRQLRTLLRSPLVDDGRLHIDGAGRSRRFACQETGVRLPTIAGIPCLFADADEEIARWVAQRDAFARETATTGNGILAQLAGTTVRPDVRLRLERLHRALQDHRHRISALLEEAGLPAATGAAARPVACARRNPAEARLDAYLHQVHRDWGWGAAHGEIGEALEDLRAALGDFRPGTMLVFGGGSSRLPYELHRRAQARCTVVLDVDVLSMTIASSILAGETIALTEFPSGPRDAETTAVQRHLRAEPAELTAVSSFHLIFADGLAPPVTAESFDTVLTPWFIDQGPSDLAEFAEVVHRVLRPGGLWLNHGPLIYEPLHTMLIHRYTADEVRAIVEESGFEVEHWSYEPRSFLQSPASTRGRTETVLTFAAVKRPGTAPTKPTPRDDPAWLLDPTLPAEPWPGLAGYEPPHPMFAAVIALLDGRRSLEAIARVMVNEHGLPQDAALEGIRAALRDMLRATT